MRLTRISLSNFRNYLQLDWDPPAGPIILQGPNAQGKTNLLEAIYCIATGSSPRTTNDGEMISWRARGPLGYARLMGKVSRAGSPVRLEIVLIQQPVGEMHKEVRINGAKRRAFELWGHLRAVLFLPEDVDLLTGAPAQRRRYLDRVISQLDRQYARALAQYERVLTQRNHLLRRLRERGGDPRQLEYWDGSLAALAAALLVRRQKTVREWEAIAKVIHRELSGGTEELSLTYQTAIEEPGPARNTIQEGELTAEFIRRLELSRREEIERGQTTLGPHRDDLRLATNSADLIDYGSRGQQRTAALALKLAEAGLIAGSSGEAPLLLLDDILSELDEARRRYLLASLEKAEQVFLTTTQLGAVPAGFLKGSQLYQVRQGSLAPGRRR